MTDIAAELSVKHSAQRALVAGRRVDIMDSAIPFGAARS